MKKRVLPAVTLAATTAILGLLGLALAPNPPATAQQAQPVTWQNAGTTACGSFTYNVVSGATIACSGGKANITIAGAGGTVTSVACGTNMSCSPSPIVGTGTVSLSNAISLTSVATTSADTGVSLANAGNVKWLDPAAGINAIGLKAPASIGTSIGYTWPSTNPTNGQVLTSTSGGVWSWTTPTTGTVTSVATSTGLTGGTITTTGTLSVDQTSSLTWSGTETFNNAIVAPGITRAAAASAAITSTCGTTTTTNPCEVHTSGTTNYQGVYTGTNLYKTNNGQTYLDVYPLNSGSGYGVGIVAYSPSLISGPNPLGIGVVIDLNSTSLSVDSPFDESKAQLTTRRLAFNGTALATTDWTAAAGWGTGRSVSAVGGSSTDSQGTVTITAGSSPSANPTFQLTFKDGSWTASAPNCYCRLVDTTQNTTSQLCTATATQTTATFTYGGSNTTNATPTNTSTYTFYYSCTGVI